MSSTTAKKGTFSVTAYRGDAKTLLAFNLSDKKSVKNLAGFTILCQPKGKDAFFIQNQLRFESAGDHAQDPKEPATSSINAPIHKFRWLHIPGSIQGTKPFLGEYVYTVTPRYFEGKSLQPLDPKLSASVPITVDGFDKKGLELGFTRGFTLNRRHSSGTSASRQKSSPMLQAWFSIQASNREPTRRAINLLFRTNTNGSALPRGQRSSIF